LEPDSAHFQEALFFRLDSLEEGRIGKLEFVILSWLESIIGLRLRDLLDESFEIALVTSQLEAVQMKSVRNGVVQEGGVMRDDD
jgi:hypothetical protein